jgi:hypothetical protein
LEDLPCFLLRYDNSNRRTHQVYGAEDPAFTFTNNAGLPADAFQGQLSRVSGNNVGSYSYTLGNLSAGVNYSLSLSTTAPVPSFTITAKPVIITATPGQTKVYGSPDPVFTFTNNGSITNFTGALSRLAVKIQAIMLIPLALCLLA